MKPEALCMCMRDRELVSYVGKCFA